MLRIVMADDHPIVRKGLRTLLEAEPDCEVIGEADDGPAALDLVERLKPDILLVDVMMPGLGGLEVTRQVSHRWPATRVIVLSMHSNEPYVLEALHNGAAAYVLKTTSTHTLVEAVREVAAGHRYLSPPLTERAIQAYTQQARQATQAIDRYDLLTTREREILQLAAEGLSNADIGERLHISPRTAETHRANLLRKLGLNTQTELLKYALQRGLITGE
jgi:DNA-binding NarL/FixJ family response regulator